MGRRVGFIERQGRRGDGLPGTFGQRTTAAPGNVRTGLAAGVGELDTRDGALGLDIGRDAGPRGDVIVLPDAGAAGSDAAVWMDGGGFGDDRAGADGSGAQVDQVPVGGEAVDGGVLAHRRDEDAIVKGHAAKR